MNRRGFELTCTLTIDGMEPMAMRLLVAADKPLDEVTGGMEALMRSARATLMYAHMSDYVPMSVSELRDRMAKMTPEESAEAFKRYHQELP